MTQDDDEDLLGISERIDRLKLGKLMLSIGNYDRALTLLQGLRGKYTENEELQREVDALIAEAEAKAKQPPEES
jgi:hypothetical protein